MILLLLTLVQYSSSSHMRHVLPLEGSVKEGNYYSYLYIGTPPQEQSVVINTKIDVLTVQCQKFTKCKSNHINPLFNLYNSATSSIPKCNTLNQPIVNSYNSYGNNKCTFNFSYINNNFITGFFVEDVIALERNTPEKIKTKFGCCYEQTSSVYTLGANGIFGLAPHRKNTFISDLYKNYNVKTAYQKIFSICFGEIGGQLVLGHPRKDLHSQASIKTTFSDENNQYNIERVGQISLGDFVVKKSSESIVMVLEANSQRTYLRRSNYKLMLNQLQNLCRQHSDRCKKISSYEDTRVRFKITRKKPLTESQTILSVFPSFDMKIDGFPIHWSPLRYLIPKYNQIWELNIWPSSKYILGAGWMAGRDIVFDLGHKTIEIFSESNCQTPYDPAKDENEGQSYGSENNIEGQIQHNHGIDEFQNEIHYASFQLSELIPIGIVLLIIICIKCIKDRENNRGGKEDAGESDLRGSEMKQDISNSSVEVQRKENLHHKNEQD